MRKRGFTLLETAVVVFLLAVLSVFSFETITQFKKSAALEEVSREFASTLRQARNKSLAGELGPAEQPEDFEEDGLPRYGVSATGDTYVLFKEQKLLGQTSFSKTTLESFEVDSSLALSLGEVVFTRITGTSPSVVFSLSRNDGGGAKEVSIGDLGLIAIKDL